MLHACMDRKRLEGVDTENTKFIQKKDANIITIGEKKSLYTQKSAHISITNKVLFVSQKKKKKKVLFNLRIMLLA